MFTITKEWIAANRSQRGGFTKAQLAAIGVDWPPIHGWPHRVIGTRITEEAKNQFEFTGANNHGEHH